MAAKTIVPIKDTERKWTMWGINDIYGISLTGSDSNGSYVPNIDDYVLNPKTYEVYIVTSINETTQVAVISPIDHKNLKVDFNPTDILFGVGSGSPSETYRIYIDKSSGSPYTLSVESRLKIHAFSATKAKIYKGSPDEASNVISRVYDNAGVLESEYITLLSSTTGTGVYHTVKYIPSCRTSENLDDGDVLTIVLFSDQDIVVSKRQVIVENTTAIRITNPSNKIISDISLKSDFLSATLTDVIEYPLNLTKESLNLTGIVHYTDGSTLELPVNGTKFTMFGLKQYIPSRSGQELRLVLKYTLSADESAVSGNNNGELGHISKDYKLKTIDKLSSLSVKLFGYPIFINANAGYKMHWWLLGLERDIFYNVTDHVSFESDNPYSSKEYGTIQSKVVNLNLSDVASIYKNYKHIQNFNITQHLSNFSINNEPNIIGTKSYTNTTESLTPPSDAVVGYINNSNKITLATGSEKNVIIAADPNVAGSLDRTVITKDWLKDLYLSTQPLVNNTGDDPATPTHLVIVRNDDDLGSLAVSGTKVDVVKDLSTFSDTDPNMIVLNNHGYTEDDTLVLKFISRSNNIDSILSVVCLRLIEE